MLSGGVVLHRRPPRGPPWVGFVEIDDAGQMKRLMAGVQEIVAELLDTRRVRAGWRGAGPERAGSVGSSPAGPWTR